MTNKETWNQYELFVSRLKATTLPKTCYKPSNFLHENLGFSLNKCYLEDFFRDGNHAESPGYLYLQLVKRASLSDLLERVSTDQKKVGLDSLLKKGRLEILFDVNYVFGNHDDGQNALDRFMDSSPESFIAMSMQLNRFCNEMEDFLPESTKEPIKAVKKLYTNILDLLARIKVLHEDSRNIYELDSLVDGINNVTFGLFSVNFMSSCQNSTMPAPKNNPQGTLKEGLYNLKKAITDILQLISRFNSLAEMNSDYKEFLYDTVKLLEETVEIIAGEKALHTGRVITDSYLPLDNCLLAHVNRCLSNITSR